MYDKNMSQCDGFLYHEGMISAPIWIITVCMAFIACMLVALVLIVLRKLVRIVEQATSDQTNPARMRALDDRLEACEQRSRTALAKYSDVALQFDRLDEKLKSHMAREAVSMREYKRQSQEETETDEMAEFLAAAQAVPVVESDDHPSNNRRRKRRRRRSE